MNETSVENAVRVSMSCKTTDLVETLKFLKGAVPKNSKGKQYSCEITFKTNEAQFVVIGSAWTLYCKVTGPVKVTIPLLYLYDIARKIDEYNTHISVGDGFITVNGTAVFVWTFFFEDDTILRSIDLPINFSPSDIIKLPELYTISEIEFNNLSEFHRRVYETLTKDIKQVFAKLKKYGFTQLDIEKIIRDKVYNNNSKSN